MISTWLLLGLTLVAAVTDLRKNRIYNWTTYPGMLLGFAVSALEPGGIGLGESVWGFLCCGFLVLVCFVLFQIGGGDVKLMAMIGAFLGLQGGLLVLLWTCVLGSVIALGWLVWRVGAWRLATRAARRILWMLRLGSWMPLTDAERQQLQPRLSLGPAAFVSVVIVKFSLVESAINRGWL